MKEEQTYTADIYVGLMPGYNKPNIDFKERRQLVENICQKYCNAVGMGLTITDMEFIYTDGSEKGVVIGLINYPRFPKDPKQIRDIAKELVSELMLRLEQERISVVCSDVTTMYEKSDFKEME